MNDRIEEIKVRCELAKKVMTVLRDLDDIRGEQTIRSAAADILDNCGKDLEFLLGEIERLKMMLDAATSGQETMQKQWAEDVAERDAAVADLTMIEHCGTCKHEKECHLGTCDTGCYEWRRVQK